MVKAAWNILQWLGWLVFGLGWLVMWYGKSHLEQMLFGYTILGIGQCMVLIGMIPNFHIWLAILVGFMYGFRKAG